MCVGGGGARFIFLKWAVVEKSLLYSRLRKRCLPLVIDTHSCLLLAPPPSVTSYVQVDKHHRSVQLHLILEPAISKDPGNSKTE